MQERQRQFVRLQMPMEFVESNTEQPFIVVAVHVKLQKSHCFVELLSLWVGMQAVQVAVDVDVVLTHVVQYGTKVLQAAHKLLELSPKVVLQSRQPQLLVFPKLSVSFESTVRQPGKTVTVQLAELTVIYGPIRQ
jgi:hypothetical protein